MTLKEQLDEKVSAQRQAMLIEQQRLEEQQCLEEMDFKAFQDLPQAILGMIQKQFESLDGKDLMNGYTIHIVCASNPFSPTHYLKFCPTDTVIADSVGLSRKALTNIMSQVARVIPALGLEHSSPQSTSDAWKFTYVPPTTK